MAWDLRRLGFATWAPTRDAVIARAPERLQAHQAWLAGHGLDAGSDAIGSPSAAGPDDAGSSPVTILETVSGNEVLFDHDRHPAAPAEIERCLRLLSCSRNDLLATVAPMSDALLDWDPPYRNFFAWARWRTIRQVLGHIASTEVGYYLPLVGYDSPDLGELSGLTWPEQLRRSRAQTVRFLEGLLGDGEDRLRLYEADEAWSVRKVLRRLVWHELVHLKSIRRIAREYAGRGGIRTKDG